MPMSRIGRSRLLSTKCVNKTTCCYDGRLFVPYYGATFETEADRLQRRSCGLSE